MDIIKESIDFLKTMTDCNIDEIALQNILNAKLANMICLKGCSFRQFSNSTPRTVSYYAMNFMHSGTRKDYTVDCINDYLLPFVKEEVVKAVNNKKNQLQNELSMVSPKNKKEKEKIEAEIKKVREAQFELENPNYTGLYAEAQQIKDLGIGGIFIRMSELGDYLDEIVSGNSSKKTLYNSLKTIYEGKISPNVIQGDGKRSVLENVPVQALMYTDYENLFDEKIKRFYVSNLKTGMARRCFIYIPKEKNKKLNYPTRYDLVEEAIRNAVKLSKKYKEIFDSIETNAIYDFSEEAKELLYKYQNRCLDIFNNSKDKLIFKMERKESFWKCTKLAVIYSVIDKPYSKIVESKYVLKAIDFYESIHEGLKNVINNRELTDSEKIVEYFIQNTNKMITKTELRKMNLISNLKFSRYWDKNIRKEVEDDLEETYKISFVESKIGKTVYYKAIPKEAMPVVDDEKDKIKLSISHENTDYPTHDYKYKEITIDEFKEEIKTGCGFCGGEFKDGHRKKENFLGGQNTIWLDFDDGNLCLDDAKSLFRDNWYVIYTTKKHRKEGHGDRFRVVLKCKEPLPSNIEDFERIMNNIIDVYDTDGACKDCSRLFLGSKNSEIYTNYGDYFDWRQYDFIPEKEETNYEISANNYNNLSYKNNNRGLTDETLFTNIGDKILKVSEIGEGSRDCILNNALCILVSAVRNGDVKHQNAIDWFEYQLSKISTKNFKQNAEKFRQKIKDLSI